MQQVKMREQFQPLLLVILLTWFGMGTLHAQFGPPPISSYGPHSGVFREGGNGLIKSLDPAGAVFDATVPWSLYCWFRSDEPISGPTLLSGLGNPLEEYSRYFALQNGKLMFRIGEGSSLTASSALGDGALQNGIYQNKDWHFVAAASDGVSVHLYADGVEVATGQLARGRVSPILQMAPEDQPWPDAKHFGGKIALLTLLPTALSAADVQQMYAHRPDFSLIEFEEASKAWPVQTREQAGYRAPQDGATMPRSAAPFALPVQRPAPPARTSLKPRGRNEWVLEGGWKLTPAPKVSAGGASISETGFDSKQWWAARVPGTVLTTMVDRGVYPDPDYGLNNLAIPESLNKQDYWYRAEFRAPKSEIARNFMLTLNGINYAAVVWMNGKRLGDIKGAFIRGSFDVTGILKAGEMNAIAVRVSPPPHPGIPQEQSIKGGPGENGGIMVMDGPTFMATEGWDWILGIRDRNTGIWQDVTLTASAQVRIGDPRIITTLPLPDTSRADVAIDVPLTNLSGAPVSGSVTASFDQITVTKQVTLPPGESTINLSPSEFTQLTVQNPRLWWPNGYGKPELYTLKLSFSANHEVSDTKELTFGIREITYELSLYDSAGHLRRVEISLAKARAKDEQIVDVTHEGMRQIPHGWVASLTPAGESSTAVKQLEEPQLPADVRGDDVRGDVLHGPVGVHRTERRTPDGQYFDRDPGITDLVIKVNGVKIACRGGNWGMDDSRKRVSREHLEPYFRMYRDANLNIIRNWVGQDTEEAFYDLADKYGQLIWNDFWATTEDYNMEPEDPELFLKNARDTILHFRNHPSIVLWCGRNEGVPQPIINKGLADLIYTLDGTRYYSPSSNRVNLRNSGPYKFQNPETYYEINRGFSVELGVPSMPTLESFRAWIPEADQWPISDDWAYHDWHQAGNGDVAPFMQEIETEFGAATNLEDFERKAQMLNYVEHRAIFEGFNAHLWTPNSGRLLWMTQPAWPSSNWQILSHDYDTQASFYGVKKACESLHPQLDLSNGEVDVVNITATTMQDVSLSAKIYSLDNKLLFENSQKLQLAPNALTHGYKLNLGPLLSSDQVVFVKLTLNDSTGKAIADNFYWLGATSASYREMNKLPPASLSASATSAADGDEMNIHVELRNQGPTAALANKLTLENASDGTRILPAYLSDNYVSLLPGESRGIDIEYPSNAAQGPAKIAIRGWNLPTITVPVSTH